jgi:TRAP-type C4-dicarboxylate transport system permease small subunit
VIDRLKALERVLVRAESAALVALVTFMVVMAFLQVAARQLFHTGLLWGDTLLRHLVLWVGFLGAALATVEEKHFAWDTVVGMMKDRTKAAFLAAANLAAAVITWFLLKAAWAYLLEEKAGGKALFEVAGRPIPEWWFVVIVPLGFGLIFVHLLIKAVREGAAAAGGGEA